MHDAVVNHIRTTNLPRMVQKFGMLRMALVEHKIQELSACYQAAFGGYTLPAMPSAPGFPFAMPENESMIGTVDPMHNMVTDDYSDRNFPTEGGYM